MIVTPIRAVGQPLDPLVAKQLEASTELQAQWGKVPSHAVLSGDLGHGESASVQVHTCASIEYLAVGACDSGCGDLNLTAYNSSDEDLDSDVLFDDVPILSFTPAICGFTTISVEMVSCTGSCDWGVQVYIDDAMAPDAASGPGDRDAPALPSDWDRYLGTYRGPAGDTSILRHENSLMVLFPLSQSALGATGVLQPTDEPHVFRVESEGSNAQGARVRFEVNDIGEVTRISIGANYGQRVE